MKPNLSLNIISLLLPLLSQGTPTPYCIPTGKVPSDSTIRLHPSIRPSCEIAEENDYHKRNISLMEKVPEVWDRVGLSCEWQKWTTSCSVQFFGSEEKIVLQRQKIKITQYHSSLTIRKLQHYTYRDLTELFLDNGFEHAEEPLYDCKWMQESQKIVEVMVCVKEKIQFEVLYKETDQWRVNDTWTLSRDGTVLHYHPLPLTSLNSCWFFPGPPEMCYQKTQEGEYSLICPHSRKLYNLANHKPIEVPGCTPKSGVIVLTYSGEFLLLHTISPLNHIRKIRTADNSWLSQYEDKREYEIRTSIGNSHAELYDWACKQAQIRFDTVILANARSCKGYTYLELGHTNFICSWDQSVIKVKLLTKVPITNLTYSILGNSLKITGFYNGSSWYVTPLTGEMNKIYTVSMGQGPLYLPSNRMTHYFDLISNTCIPYDSIERYHHPSINFKPTITTHSLIGLQSAVWESFSSNVESYHSLAEYRSQTETYLGFWSSVSTWLSEHIWAPIGLGITLLLGLCLLFVTCKSITRKAYQRVTLGR